MNRIVHYTLILVTALFILAFWLYLDHQKKTAIHPYQVLLVTYSPLDSMGTAIKNAYTSVLEEEGVPFRWVKRGEILKFKPIDIVDTNPVIIFPDYISLKIPLEFETWITEYITVGGNVLITNDAGIRMRNNRYRNTAVFSSLLGMNYITYDKFKADSFRPAKLQFKDRETAEIFQVPPGKRDELNYITSYVYGALQYPVARVDIDNISDAEIFAYSVYENGTRDPNILYKDFHPGSLLFANLPLGYLKAYSSDEFLLRMVLRTYLFKIVKIAHICKMPYNKAGLALNWQVESNREWRNIPRLEEKGVLRQNFPVSTHISAGEWLNQAGDGLGFDAMNHTQLVKKLQNYGTIGSLGGWAANWFAGKLSQNELTKEEVEQYIGKNNEMLQRITGKGIREFTSPRSLYNQNIARILEKNAIVCFTYMGDAGSPPQRPFMQGKQFSGRMFAFPVMPHGKHATVQEMGKHGISAAQYEGWLLETLDYAIKNKLTTMFSANFYDYQDFPRYVEPLQRLMNQAETKREEGLLFIEPMSYFADYWNRKLNASCSFRLEEEKLYISLHSPQSLQDFTVAIPRHLCRPPAGLDMIVTEDDDYFYLTIIVDTKDKIIVCFLQ